MKTELAPAAVADLIAIAQYIARDNPKGAAAWIDRLIDRAEKAATLPRAGRVVPEIGDPAIREVFLRTYRIIYRIEPQRILVLTVFEGHRQLKRLPTG